MLKGRKITANTGKSNERKMSLDFPQLFPTLDENRKKHGDELVNTMFLNASIVKLQSAARTQFSKTDGKGAYVDTPVAVQKSVNETVLTTGGPSWVNELSDADRAIVEKAREIAKANRPAKKGKTIKAA